MLRHEGETLVCEPQIDLRAYVDQRWLMRREVTLLNSVGEDICVKLFAFLRNDLG